MAIFCIQGSCDVLRLVDLEQSPDYEKILAFRQTTPGSYLTGPGGADFQQSPRQLHQRAQSAPHKLPCHAPRHHHSRPRTSLGLSPRRIKEEDEEENEEENEEEDMEGEGPDMESVTVTSSQTSSPRTNRRMSKLSGAVDKLMTANRFTTK